MPPRLLAFALALLTTTACKPAGAGATAPAEAPAPVATRTPPAQAFFPWTRSCSRDLGETAACAATRAPVCGQKADLTVTTYADRCAACSDPKVLYTTPGACEART